MVVLYRRDQSSSVMIYQRFSQTFLLLLIGILCYKISTIQAEVEIQDGDPASIGSETYFKINSSLITSVNSIRYEQVLLYNTHKCRIDAERCKNSVLFHFLCTFLLLQAGDLETNPGPRPLKYPCQVCHLACKWGQQAVRCDTCYLWYHKDCMLMTTEEYDNLNRTEASWICWACGTPNFSLSILRGDVDFTHTNSFQPLSNSTIDEADMWISAPTATSSPKDDSTTSRRRISSSKSSRNFSKTSGRNKTTGSNGKKLKVIVVNCQSVKNKARELDNMIQSSDPDVILGTESWLNKDVLDGEIFPENYSVIRKDRTTGKTGGGGVFIAYRNDIILTHRADLDADCELLWAQLQIKDAKSVFLGCFYRPPNDGIESLHQLDQSLSKLYGSNNSPNAWIGGDFNLSEIEWDTCTVQKYATKGPLCQPLLKMTTEYNLTQMITQPTYRTDDSESLLDLFLTTNPTTVQDVFHMPGLGLCKHDSIMVQINTQPRRSKTPPRKIFLFRKMDSEGISREAQEFCTAFLNSHPEQHSVEQNWCSFRDEVTMLASKHIPTKLIRSYRDLPWMTRELKHLIRRKNRWHKKAKRSKSRRVWEKYCDLQKQAKAEMRRCYNNYISNTLGPKMEENPKIFWRHVNRGIRRDNNSGISALRNRGQLISDAMEKCNILSDYFKSVFTKEDTTTIPEKVSSPAFPTMPSFSITSPGVEKLLLGLNPSKAAGPDGLPSRILKILAPQIAPILTFIFNQSLQTGTLPHDWKSANITPIFKKGDRAEAKNYRPVSLTSICCKVMEHVVHSQMMDHLDRYQILTDTQHGFRKRRSCDSQLLITQQDLSSALDQKKSVDVVILDFTKAFDTVPHLRLLSKLKYYGINDQLLSWISSFLIGRSQRVVLEGKTSTAVSVDSGVPQGTVLGPLLFLLYINDLPERITSSTRLFADDALVYRTISSTSDSRALQDDLDSLTKWQHDWQMQFNPSKCYVMHVTNTRSPVHRDYKLCNQTLAVVKSHPYLGVHLQDDMGWSTHIGCATSKASRMLGVVRRNLYSCPEKLKETAYISLVRPHVEYASMIWDPHRKNHKKQVERIQRSAARFVKSNYERTKGTVTTLLNDLKWQSLEEREESSTSNDDVQDRQRRDRHPQ